MFFTLAASFAFLAAATPSVIAVDPLTASSVGGVAVENRTAVGPVVGTNGTTTVTVFQTGRYYGDAAAAMGFATTSNGTSFYPTLFPNLTRATNPGNPFDRITFASVAWNQRYGEFLVSMLPISNTPSNGDEDTTLPPIVLRSSNGLSWTAPQATSPGGIRPEKNFIACDNSLSSRYYGNCYVAWDDGDVGFLFHANTSTNGGVTWGPSVTAADNHAEYGGIPVVLPNGTVVVVSEDGNGYDGDAANIISSVSTNGGASWSAAYEVSSIAAHPVAGGMRTQSLPTVAVDASGNIYAVWQDCRFRAACSSNDLVMSTSRNGVNWSAPVRLNLDPVTSGIDHFLPTIAIRNSWFGTTIGLSYYAFPNANCTASTCQLDAMFSNSGNGGASWSSPTELWGPMSLAWLADTSAGAMVGDYLTAAYPSAYEAPIAIAGPPAAGIYNEPIAIVPWNFLGGLGGSPFALDADAKAPAARGLGAADDKAMHLGAAKPSYLPARRAPKTHPKPGRHRGM